MTVDLDDLLKNTPSLCKGNRLSPNSASGISTGFAQLDAVLVGKGWPLGAVTELLPEAMGIGELQLLLPAIRDATRRRQRVLIVNAPYQPYAPALAQADIDLDYLFVVSPLSREDALWAAEKALHGGICKILLLWPDGFGNRPTDNTTIRRLQVAAQTHGSATILYRHPSQPSHVRINQSNWAALRLKLSSTDKGFRVDVLKAVGSHAKPSVLLGEGFQNQDPSTSIHK